MVKADKYDNCYMLTLLKDNIELDCSMMMIPFPNYLIPVVMVRIQNLSNVPFYLFSIYLFIFLLLITLDTLYMKMMENDAL